LRDSVAVKVRGKRIAEITAADQYRYGNVPVINGRGFEIKVHSDEDVSQLLREYDEAGESRREEFFRKWAAFDTYRKVVIK
jgi:sulfate adenylyltransferase subunit 1